MRPPSLFRSRTVVITVASGFAFMVGYYGLPFVISLFLQQHRQLTALRTGVVFLPMMLIGLVLTPFSARIGDRLGRRTLIVARLAVMALGLAAVGLQPPATPLWLLAALMVLVGLGPSGVQRAFGVFALTPWPSRSSRTDQSPLSKGTL